MKLLLIIVAWLLAFPIVHAETVKYVRDQVYVPVRSGPSVQHRILRNAGSGTRLTVVRPASTEGYILVRTEDGLEGWIEEQYLSERPIARELLGKAEAELAQLRKQNETLREELQAARAAASESAREVESLKSAGAERDEELERIRHASGNAIAIERENRRLQEQVEGLGSQLKAVSMENERLQMESRSRAFLHGAYAVVIGVVITILVPRLWPRRRRSEWA